MNENDAQGTHAIYPGAQDCVHRLFGSLSPGLEAGSRKIIGAEIRKIPELELTFSRWASVGRLLSDLVSVFVKWGCIQCTGQAFKFSFPLSIPVTKLLR